MRPNCASGHKRPEKGLLVARACTYANYGNLHAGGSLSEARSSGSHDRPRTEIRSFQGNRQIDRFAEVALHYAGCRILKMACLRGPRKGTPHNNMLRIKSRVQGMERGLSECILHCHAGRPAHPSRRCHKNRRRQLSSARKRTGSRNTEEKEMISKMPQQVNGYVATVLQLYLQLPETPDKPNANDRKTAEGLQSRGITLATVESALLLATARRLGRPPDLPTLSPIRSLLISCRLFKSSSTLQSLMIT
jgi:hypothetical protein